MSTIGAALCRAGAALREAGIDNPTREARALLAHALNLTPEALLRDRHENADTSALDPLVARRAAHEPLALILGHREFWSLDFLVSPATLIPRADSETLIEAALDAFPRRADVRRILDLGTGTGALLLAALTEFPAAFGLGVDRPEPAALAARNAARLGLSDRAAFAAADWAAPVQGAFDLILANPPYVETAAIPGLMPEVAHFEPASALDGGADGLDAYRRIIPELPRLLAPRGAAILELGVGQAGPVSRLAASFGLAGAVRDDLGGISRALVLRSGG